MRKSTGKSVGKHLFKFIKKERNVGKDKEGEKEEGAWYNNNEMIEEIKGQCMWGRKRM